MKIACLGWGSLIWRPENLKIQSAWFEDGPLLPIEFTRQSDNGRITLIIDEQAKPVRTLWALMTTDMLPLAIESLKEREGVTRDEAIHNVIATDDNTSNIKAVVIKWLNVMNLDTAIWTGLSYSAKTNKLRPTIDYVINHLKELDYNSRKTAEEYIRKAHKQIDTEYRRRIEHELGWSPIN